MINSIYTAYESPSPMSSGTAIIDNYKDAYALFNKRYYICKKITPSKSKEEDENISKEKDKNCIDTNYCDTKIQFNQTQIQSIIKLLRVKVNSKIDYTIEDIAGLLGIPVDSITSMLNALQAQGYVRKIGSHIQVLPSIQEFDIRTLACK